jgi:hypothetical protein
MRLALHELPQYREPAVRHRVPVQVHAEARTHVTNGEPSARACTHVRLTDGRRTPTRAPAAT